ncbi:gamma subclass chorismate mutase AroQ [Williamsia herbipolensis]|uniref:gamma subclass chorismate mutase AroQ n=1 Tax=Williamsia herbipolensis TaxID=1603258 RepID=UPI00069836A5|nr:gamma subclass chorismate mutase AroQ [Williamsia herbipolensis]
MTSRARLVLALVVTTLAASVPAAAASAAPTTSTSTTSTPTTSLPMTSTPGAGAIVAPVVDRLLLADAVARSKWVTHSAIDDPARERAVIDAAVAGASPATADRVRAVVRDQIEASKTVQRGLFAGWRAAPWTAPRADTDLSSTRRRISDLTTDIVARVVGHDPRDPACLADVASATLRTVAERALTPLQTVASVQAERSLCAL